MVKKSPMRFGAKFKRYFTFKEIRNSARPGDYLIGDDPASVSYVRMKQRACEALGIATKSFHFPNEMSQSD